MIIKEAFNSSQLPEYHEGMLIVKINSSNSPAGMMAMTAEASGSSLNSPGISALSFYEKAGLIKQVTAISGSRSENIQPMGSVPNMTMSVMASSLVESDAKDLNRGVNLVEMEKDADVSGLQVALANDPNVEFVSRVPVRYLAVAKTAAYKTGAARARKTGAGIAAVPPPASTMWNLKKINWEGARALPGFSDAGSVKVAVLDTGIDKNHPDFNGANIKYTFAHPDLPGASGSKDLIGHGTHVAGTIGANSNNSLGINGICGCNLFAWKIFDDQADFVSFPQGFVYFVDPVMYRRALAECLQQRIDVINLSIGGGGKPDPHEQSLFDSLLANGTTIVAAMGNSRRFGSPTSYPAAIPGVIAVGATNIDDSVAIFSNAGNHITLSAPGVSVWSTLPTYPGQFGFAAVPGPNGRPVQGMAQRRETDYDAWNGTSMATPHVTAAVALLIANKGKSAPSNVRKSLMRTADPVPGMNGAPFHPDFGAGRLNLLKLLK